MPTVHIAPLQPQSPPYDVLVQPGALARLPEVLAAAAAAHRYVVVTDRVVGALLAVRVERLLRDAGMQVDTVTTEAGEAAKTVGSWEAVQASMLAIGVGRDGCVIALGGGVVGDLAGFVAATYLRGIPVVQVPTTLLAMIDASIGGKTAVDTPAGKNLIGAFHQPRAVLADPSLLATLPARELRSGMAEAVKHGAIHDRAYFQEVVDRAGELLAGDVAALTDLVAGSVRIKAAFVNADPNEAGQRQALNFGHTIGHAIEALGAFTLPHGNAVAIGMVAEAALGERLGVTEAGTADTLRAAIAALGLPDRAPSGISAADVLESVRGDKKARESRARYTLLRRIGEVARAVGGAWTHTAPDEAVRAVLES